MLANGMAHGIVFVTNGMSFREQARQKFMRIRTGLSLSEFGHPVQSPEQVHRCGPTCGQISGRFLEILQHLGHTGNIARTGSHDSPVGRCTANRRCPANLQSMNRGPDFINVRQLDHQFLLGQKRLIEDLKLA